MKAPPLGYRPLLRAGVASWLSWAWASRAHADVSSHLGALPYPVPWCPAPSTQPQAAALEEPGVRAVKLETQPPAGPAQVPLFLPKANTADTKGSRMGRSGGLLQSRAPGGKEVRLRKACGFWAECVCLEFRVLRHEPLAVTSSTSGCSCGVLVVMGQMCLPCLPSLPLPFMR